MGERRGRLRAGDSLVIPAGVPHRLWNAGAGEARAFVEVRPGRGFERFFERYCALGRSGRLSAGGSAGPLEMASLAREHGLYLARPPLVAQRLAAALLAPLARALTRRQPAGA
jgi:Cupin domain